MPATSQKLIQRSLVQPGNRTLSKPDRIKVCCRQAALPVTCMACLRHDGYLQLCNFDMKSPTLNERIAVVFAFPGHLAADALRSSLRGLLDVRLQLTSLASTLIAGDLPGCMQRYPVCCGRLSIGKGEGCLVCNSAGRSIYHQNQRLLPEKSKAASLGLQLSNCNRCLPCFLQLRLLAAKVCRFGRCVRMAMLTPQALSLPQGHLFSHRSFNRIRMLKYGTL